MSAADPSLAQLLITDTRSGTTFLIDTGAQVSLLPRRCNSRISPPGFLVRRTKNPSDFGLMDYIPCIYLVRVGLIFLSI